MLPQKKAQEEITGFVIIVVMISVLFMVFLGIMFSQNFNKSATPSKDVSSYLEAVTEVTTPCAVYGDEYATIGKLFDYCYSGKSCLSGVSACSVLNSTLLEMFNATLPFSAAHERKGFTFYLEAVSDSSQATQVVLAIAKGNCTGFQVTAASPLITVTKTLSYKFTECY